MKSGLGQLGVDINLVGQCFGCSTVRCSAVQYSTVQYSTVQYSTVQYSAARMTHWTTVLVLLLSLLLSQDWSLTRHKSMHIGRISKDKMNSSIEPVRGSWADWSILVCIPPQLIFSTLPCCNFAQKLWERWSFPRYWLWTIFYGFLWIFCVAHSCFQDRRNPY